MSSYLPQHPGLLPPWLLLVTGASLFNSIQCYLTLHFVGRIYDGPRVTYIPTPGTSASASSSFPHKSKPHPQSQVTPLSARTFSAWTLLAAGIRLAAAYRVDDPVLYALAAWTFAVAELHFAGEVFWFRTARLGSGTAAQFATATGSLVWLAAQRGFYLGRG